jgi:hypothetical protein
LAGVAADPNISTGPRRLRRRKRFFVEEALPLRIADLVKLVRGDLESLRVRWPALDFAITVERLAGDSLRVVGAGTETNVTLTSIRAGHAGARQVFVCPECQRPCRQLFLPPGFTSFACRRCRRIRCRERAGPSPIDRLQDDWARIGGQIEHLRVMQTRGQRPEIGGVEVDIKALRRQLRDLQRRVEAAAPPQAG